MKRLVILFLTSWSILLYGQPAQGDWQTVLRQWMTSEDMEEGYSEEVMDYLAERAESPINLNNTTREELEQLPFLSAQAVEGIIAYLDHYRPMRTLNELRMITALDYDVRQLLVYFVCCGDTVSQRRVWPTLAEVAKDGKHQLMVTGKIPFYERRGDRDGYLGYKYRHDVRYQFNYKNRVKFGLTGSQDAGEPFFANKNTLGYDHYALYFQLRNMGRLEELNLGTYRVQMGMGLVMNTGFYLGKLATLQSLGRSSHTLTAHASRSSASYLQGAAATVRLSKEWKVTAFASYRGIDATLNDDGSARTLLSDGYHRTQTEMDKKNNTYETDLGGSVGWRRGTLYVNANTVFTHFNRTLSPLTNTLYRRYAAEGNSFFNASLDYGYTNYRWTIGGETAINKSGALAALHTVGFKVSDQLSLMALHRYYDKRYTALHARSFSEGSSVQNEHGLYLGATWRPSWSWTLQGYADYAHFSWPRYLVSVASDAFDAMLASRYTRDSWSLEGRYRLHVRQQDDNDKLRLVNKTEHRLRLAFRYTLSPTLSLNTQGDGVATSTKNGRQKGVMLSEQATFKWRWLKADALVGWFHTDDYDSRIYHYEQSVLYDFSFPMYYGHGLRYALMLRANVGQRLTATAKVGTTTYFNRSTTGSGLQEIDRSSMTDLLVQLRYVF